jgi:hypothetical protein
MSMMFVSDVKYKHLCPKGRLQPVTVQAEATNTALHE